MNIDMETHRCLVCTRQSSIIICLLTLCEQSLSGSSFKAIWIPDKRRWMNVSKPLCTSDGVALLNSLETYYVDVVAVVRRCTCSVQTVFSGQ